MEAMRSGFSRRARKEMTKMLMLMVKIMAEGWVTTVEGLLCCRALVQVV